MGGAVVIAIDGPSGVGKSTVTRRLATVMGLEFLDTGATYRAATIAALRTGADLTDEDTVLAAVTASEIAYADGTILLDGESVAEEVRSDAVTKNASAVSAFPRVREHVVEMQRRWVSDRGGSAVVEGRDIGTVVFPDAPVKIFLTADPEVRAARRAGDAEAAHQAVSDIVADLNRRDHADSTRKTSPLRPAADSVEVNTSEMGIEEVVLEILEVVADRFEQGRL
ncbi:MAG: (d)CMP kinase [bacterium]|nr:(d)CMP kinase [bacterium]